VDTPRPSPRTNRTPRVPHPVLIGHAASLTVASLVATVTRLATGLLLGERGVRRVQARATAQSFYAPLAYGSNGAALLPAALALPIAADADAGRAPSLAHAALRRDHALAAAFQLLQRLLRRACADTRARPAPAARRRPLGTEASRSMVQGHATYTARGRAGGARRGARGASNEPPSTEIESATLRENSPFNDKHLRVADRSHGTAHRPARRWCRWSRCFTLEPPAGLGAVASHLSPSHLSPSHLSPRWASRGAVGGRRARPVRGLVDVADLHARRRPIRHST
jgi:hypothetical protein